MSLKDTGQQVRIVSIGRVRRGLVGRVFGRLTGAFPVEDWAAYVTLRGPFAIRRYLLNVTAAHPMFRPRKPNRVAPGLA